MVFVNNLNAAVSLLVDTAASIKCIGIIAAFLAHLPKDFVPIANNFNTTRKTIVLETDIPHTA